MSKRRRMFDIDIPDEAVAQPPEPRIRGFEPMPPGLRRGPMATAIAETADATRQRAELEAKIRAENDALAHEHVRLKRLGLVAELVPLDRIDSAKLVRDRRLGEDEELAELVQSIREIGLSNPIRLESTEDGRYELIQGYRRLTAYRRLLEETGDAERWGAIPAMVSAPGEGLDALYRRMVDENLVRKDISFAEMAMLALDYAADPETEENDPDRAVALLFKSAGYQKRSYIRAFIPLVRALGPQLRFAEQIPRALGLALAKRLDQGEDLAAAFRAETAGQGALTAEQELAILRKLAGQDQPEAAPAPAPKGSTARPARARTSFQFDRPEGRGKCVAANGKLEIQLPVDFTTIDRRRLEQAVRQMLQVLDD